jgi:hypothetical protein
MGNIPKTVLVIVGSFGFNPDPQGNAVADFTINVNTPPKTHRRSSGGQFGKCRLI